MIAACFGLAAFAAATAVGLAAGNSAQTVLLRATGAMLVCFGVGWGVGAVAQKTLQAEIEAYKLRNPIPIDEPPGAQDAAGADADPLSGAAATADAGDAAS